MIRRPIDQTASALTLGYLAATTADGLISLNVFIVLYVKNFRFEFFSLKFNYTELVTHIGIFIHGKFIGSSHMNERSVTVTATVIGNLSFVRDYLFAVVVNPDSKSSRLGLSPLLWIIRWT